MKKLLTFFIVFSFFPTAYANIPKKLIPCGDTVGIGILTEGLLVVDTKKFECENGDKISPAEKANIKPGDRIISADGKKMDSSEELLNYVLDRKNDIILTVNRNGKLLNKLLTPALSNEGYRLGILVRDSVAGLGTVTYIDPITKSFGALGHGISDIDTNTLFYCRKGLLFDCSLSSPQKSKKGNPGALCADFGSKTLAQITKNTPCGIFGKFTNGSYIKTENTVDVASVNEIKQGDAVIYSNVDGEGIKEYKIKIKKFREGNLDGKNITFEVEDESLISKTGGIVQGMSGSPILQNGKLIGAVTHVFVNDPTKGYGIFIENMLTEAEKIK